MALSIIENQTRHGKTCWTERDKKLTRHYLPKINSPILDYEKIKDLCEISGLGSVHRPLDTTEDAHKEFMKKVDEIFVSNKKCKLKKVESDEDLKKHTQTIKTSSKSVGLSKKVQSKKFFQKPSIVYEPENENTRLSHNVSNYMVKSKKYANKISVSKREIAKSLRRILIKLPFQRTAEEVDELVKIFKTFKEFSSQISKPVLRELCLKATYEIWNEKDLTLFGKNGLFVILSGTVKPLTYPHKLRIDEDYYFRSPTPILSDTKTVLGFGQMFGSLKKIENKDSGSLIMSVQTLEENTEIIKFSNTDFDHIRQQLIDREQTEKYNLLQSCKQFATWTKQPLLAVAELIKWRKFTANTVITQEGYVCPFMGIIKSGQCHVLRSVSAWQNFSNGRREKRKKQVEMGRLIENDTFGEISAIKNEPMTCSIITATDCQFATIDVKDLQSLDSINLQLIEQSSVRTFAHLTEDEIHDEYVKQTLGKEWSEFKHKVMLDVLNYNAIRPGFGKWSG